MKKYLFILLFILGSIPIFSASAQMPIKILLVPGHDDEVWGSQYGNTKEADMNLSLAKELFNILKKDKRFEVHITREKGGYTKEFADYFASNMESISLFRDEAMAKRQAEISSGVFVPKTSVPHVKAKESVALKLYGLNKWANENKVDAMIHIHFNDYPRPSKWTIGKYKGFAVYIPEDQMVNSTESKLLGENIFLQLKKKYTVSTFEQEKAGLIQDQKLIALGSNGTLLPDVRSVLIEYGYIYRFKNKSARLQAYKNMSKLTAEGVKNYFLEVKN